MFMTTRLRWTTDSNANSSKCTNGPGPLWFDGVRLVGDFVTTSNGINLTRMAIEYHWAFCRIGFLCFSLSRARTLFSLTFEKDGFKYGFAQNGCCLLLWSASVHYHRSQSVQGGGRLAWDINMFTAHNAIVLMFLFFSFKNLNCSN